MKLIDWLVGCEFVRRGAAMTIIMSPGTPEPFARAFASELRDGREWATVSKRKGRWVITTTAAPARAIYIAGQRPGYAPDFIRPATRRERAEHLRLRPAVEKHKIEMDVTRLEKVLEDQTRNLRADIRRVDNELDKQIDALRERMNELDQARDVGDRDIRAEIEGARAQANAAVSKVNAHDKNLIAWNQAIDSMMKGHGENRDKLEALALRLNELGQCVTGLVEASEEHRRGIKNLDQWYNSFSNQLAKLTAEWKATQAEGGDGE